jgi:hypothetical protein
MIQLRTPMSSEFESAAVAIRSVLRASVAHESSHAYLNM